MSLDVVNARVRSHGIFALRWTTTSHHPRRSRPRARAASRRRARASCMTGASVAVGDPAASSSAGCPDTRPGAEWCRRGWAAAAPSRRRDESGGSLAGRPAPRPAMDGAVTIGSGNVLMIEGPGVAVGKRQAWWCAARTESDRASGAAGILRAARPASGEAGSSGSRGSRATSPRAGASSRARPSSPACRCAAVTSSSSGSVENDLRDAGTGGGGMLLRRATSVSAAAWMAAPMATTSSALMRSSGCRAEELLDAAPHEGDARRPADEDDLVELAHRELRDRERLLADGERALDERRREHVELVARHPEVEVEVRPAGAERDLAQLHLRAAGSTRGRSSRSRPRRAGARTPADRCGGRTGACAGTPRPFARRSRRRDRRRRGSCRPPLPAPRRRCPRDRAACSRRCRPRSRRRRFAPWPSARARTPAPPRWAR